MQWGVDVKGSCVDQTRRRALLLITRRRWRCLLGVEENRFGRRLCRSKRWAGKFMFELRIGRGGASTSTGLLTHPLAPCRRYSRGAVPINGNDDPRFSGRSITMHPMVSSARRLPSVLHGATVLLDGRS